MMAKYRAEGPSQTRYPGRATIRTALALLLPLVAGAPLIYQAATGHDPAAAAGVAGLILGVAAGITRVMALPVVNEFLSKIGLGAEPPQD
ncbi:hypothetical protein [Acaricomes phytoseiuli]|nr:hypothetical protein [Acaricomes phytoseiuli]